MTGLLTPAPSSSSFSSETSDIDENERGRTLIRSKRGRKRAIQTSSQQQQMAEDDRDTREAQRQRLDIHSFHPVLRPVASPSTSRSRSRSPVKKVLHQLRETGCPRIIIDSKSLRKEDHARAYDLLRRLILVTNSAVIPCEFKVLALWAPYSFLH